MVGIQVLWQLLDQLGKMPGQSKMSPLPQWRQDMERYCCSIPAYYGPPLRGALKRWGINAHVVPESMENNLLAGFVGNQLKRFKSQAKEIFDVDLSRIMVCIELKDHFLQERPSTSKKLTYGLVCLVNLWIGDLIIFRPSSSALASVVCFDPCFCWFVPGWTASS